MFAAPNLRRKEAPTATVSKESELGVRLKCNLSATQMAFFRNMLIHQWMKWETSPGLAQETPKNRWDKARHGAMPTFSRRGVRRTTWMAFAWTLLTGDTLYRSKVDDVDVDLRDGWLRCAKNCMF